MMSDRVTDDYRSRLQRFCDEIHALETEIGRVLIGQRETVRGTLTALVAGGHVLLEGVPGLGKTLLVRALAEAIAGKFSRIQFTPDLMPADLTGTNILIEVPDGTRRFNFQQGPVFANIVLADEINRATPKTQAALLEAMQEHTVTVAGTTHRLDDLFFVLATQNPLEMEGTYPLPEAQLDRFFCKILVPYPTAEEMLGILDRTTGTEFPAIRPICPTSHLLEMGRLVRGVPIAAELTRYAVDLVLATHPNSPGVTESVRRFVRYGASPRGAQAMLLGAKVRALLDGRFNVSRGDLQSVAPMVLRHRIILNFEGLAENITTDRIIGEIIG